MREREREKEKERKNENTVLFSAKNNTSPNLFYVESLSMPYDVRLYVMLAKKGCASWWQMGNRQMNSNKSSNTAQPKVTRARRTDAKIRESEFQSSPPPASQSASQPASQPAGTANGPAKSFDLVAARVFTIRRTAFTAAKALLLF